MLHATFKASVHINHRPSKDSVRTGKTGGIFLFVGIHFSASSHNCIVKECLSGKLSSYSTDQRQGIMHLRFDRGSASLRTRSKRGETRRKRGQNEAQTRSERGATAVRTRRYRGQNEAQPRSNFLVNACKRRRKREKRVCKKTCYSTRGLPASARGRLGSDARALVNVCTAAPIINN